MVIERYDEERVMSHARFSRSGRAKQRIETSPRLLLVLYPIWCVALEYAHRKSCSESKASTSASICSTLLCRWRKMPSITQRYLRLRRR